MQTPTRTPMATLGKFGLAQHISNALTHKDTLFLQGFGEEGIATSYKESVTVSAQSIFLEGVHFDLTYTPLQHLGYKAVTCALGKVMAMNATSHHLLISVGLSKRFFVEDVELLFQGVEAGCTEYEVKVGGLNFESSLTGISISITAIGAVQKDTLVTRSGGKSTDLICVTGNLGAAYMGMQLLEREKALFTSTQNATPQLQGKEYILQHFLRPNLCKSLFTLLHQEQIRPTSLCFLTHGLSHGVHALATASGCGAKVYIEKIPIASKTFEMAQELNMDALTCALHGGDDYEFLFTIPITQHETALRELPIDIIGHLCNPAQGILLITPEGNALPLPTPHLTE